MTNKQLVAKINSIKMQVAEGDLAIAISAFKEVLENVQNLNADKKIKYEEQYLNVSARMKNITDIFHKGSGSIDDYNKVYSQLISSFLYLCNDFSQISGKTDDIQINQIGLIKIDPEEAIELAIYKIGEAQSMKVIGMGRQHFAQLSENNHIVNYYKAIEKKLSEETKTKRPFSVKRITQHVLKDKFQNHLRQCFEIINQPKNNNKYEVILYGDLKITYTYYIINSYEEKKSTLFLTLNNEDTNINLIDTTLVFYTEDFDIISKFNKHFNQFWDIDGHEGRVISNLMDFEKFIPFDPKLLKQYNEIKNFIKRVPNDSVRMKHLQKELSLFHKRLQGLDNCLLEFRHSEKNQRVSDCFIDYIGDMKEGRKSYKTISIKHFWETLYDAQLFLSKQEASLDKGAKIERIYLVDSTVSVEIEESKSEQIAILRNYLHHMRYPTYSFSILFSSHEFPINHGENFAIWIDEDISYKVLFLIKYGLTVPGVTELSFANFGYTGNAKMLANQAKVSGYETNFDFAKKKVQEQNQRLLEYISDRKKTNFVMDADYAPYERQLNFLQRNGIADIERFLQPKQI